MLVKRNSVGLESRKQRDVIYMFVCITCGVEMVKDREAWRTQSMGLERVEHD